MSPFVDPNRELDFGFGFVRVSCVRAKLCAMIPLWLGGWGALWLVLWSYE